MFKEEILENEKRREIYRFLEKNPGVHLRKLQRDLNMPLSSVEYHLNYMVRHKILFREREGRYTRYYVRPLDARDKQIISALRQRRLREIVLTILSLKKAKYSALQEQLHLPSSTLSLYLKHLIERKILKRHKIGRENVYTIQDENAVARTLISYKSSFLDKLVDKALNTWLETEFRRSRSHKRTENDWQRL